MSKRTVYTEISPLPPHVTREVVMDFLHNHLEMIDLNPLVKERHPIQAPEDAPADERHCTWYLLTDKITYLPGGRVTGDISYTAAFHNLPNGIQTHCRAPLGVDIRSKWTLNGTLPGEPHEPVELGIGAPRTGLYIREDVDLRCNLLMAGFVKKTTKKAHATLVEALAKKANSVASGFNAGSRTANFPAATTARRSSPVGGAGSGTVIRPYGHAYSPEFGSRNDRLTSRGSPNAQFSSYRPSPPAPEANVWQANTSWHGYPTPPTPRSQQFSAMSPGGSAATTTRDKHQSTPPVSVSAHTIHHRSFSFQPDCSPSQEKQRHFSAYSPIAPPRPTPLATPSRTETWSSAVTSSTSTLTPSSPTASTPTWNDYDNDPTLYPTPLRVQKSRSSSTSSTSTATALSGNRGGRGLQISGKQQQQPPQPPPQISSLTDMYPEMNPYADDDDDNSPALGPARPSTRPAQPLVFAELAGSEVTLPAVSSQQREADESLLLHQYLHHPAALRPGSLAMAPSSLLIMDLR